MSISSSFTRSEPDPLNAKEVMQRSCTTRHETPALFSFSMAISDEIYRYRVNIANIATLYLYSKHIEEAASVYQQALAVFIQIGDQVNITKTLGNIALVRQEQNNRDEALEYFEQALEGYRELGDRHGEVTVLVNLARLHHQCGDTKQAQLFASQARLLAESLGFTDELDRLQTIFN